MPFDDQNDEENDDQTTQDSQEEQVASNDAQANDAIPAIQHVNLSPTGAPQVDRVAAIRDYLADKYAKADDTSGIKQAQQNAQDINERANIGDALESIFKAKSMAHGGQGVDTSFYQGLKQQGQQGIQQAVDSRKLAVQNYVTQNQITQQALHDTIAEGNYNAQQAQFKIAQDNNDPNSALSQRKVQGLKAIYSKVPGMDNIPWDTLSGSDADMVAKNADQVAKIKEMADAKKMQLAYQQSVLSDKKDQKQEQLYTDMNNKLTNPRGNTAVQQAQVGVLSGKKAMDLINQYPDLDKMPAQQVSLLSQEISKVASGGVGSEHGQRSVEANTLQSNWNKFVSNLSGEPTGADLKPFIEQNKRYLQNMLKTNQDAINDYQTQVYNGYKKHLTSEQDLQFRADHPDLFQVQQAQDKGVKQIMPAFQHPDADKASAWAKANPQDPRSQEILKRLGDMNAGL